ncbi:cobalamin biosynthesis protein CbiD [Halanaerobiaceae bacterium Z-7014]|uniref:Cobalt-precorrin-5B C(1)-methyltransferase n=1 Tax=Halonatronomonas betaini TaxID=2778430 RepID=A0A931F5T2_9FIRM|nr:cobalt-precorrin-5B (C(1))-methyltransferase CbiD [Halonatronomonas betaini]MBF8436180.1 cobalamin biosynthesis protein CbiD [Halonatronomonas betaini]
MAFNKYIKKAGKEYRLGYTTGTAAAGAAKAAAKLLFKNEKDRTIIIPTPAGIDVELDILNYILNDKSALASVKKDGGDDKDITDGLEIIAKIKEIEQNEIIIKGGKGVGTVTKPGLAVDVGQPAINPVPRKMIKKAIKDYLKPGSGLEVEIIVPEGEKAAAKTFNPDLGIEGGISIIGTTGIVEPMSESAYKESLALKLKQAAESGREKLVFVFGNHGKNKAFELGYQEDEIIRMSNFVGYILDEANDLELKQILIIGHIGKIIKIAGGIFNTHSKVADGRREIIAAQAALNGASQGIIDRIMQANTAEEIAADMIATGNSEIFNQLADKIRDKIKTRLEKNISVDTMIYTFEAGFIGCSEGLRKDELDIG